MRGRGLRTRYFLTALGLGLALAVALSLTVQVVEWHEARQLREALARLDALGLAEPGAAIAGTRVVLEDLLRHFYVSPVGLVLGIGVALALLAAWAMSRLVSKFEAAMQSLIRSAERIGHGLHSEPVARSGVPEVEAVENALERMREALASTTISRDYLDTLLNSMRDAVVVTTTEDRVTLVNEAGQRLFGHAAAELLGRELGSLVATEHRAAFSPAAVLEQPGETVIRTERGQTIPVSISGARVSSDDPAFKGHIYVLRDITELKKAERRIRYLARFDTLTKMPNRMQFQHLLQQALARSRRGDSGLLLLYVDLDSFKEVNDTFGHAAGDRVLETLSERLTRLLPRETVIGRLAGDEFSLFAEGIDGREARRQQAASLARLVLDEVARPLHVGEHEIYVTASIGIALCPDDADNVIDLIRNADAAMYHAKRAGRNCHSFYAPEMNAAAVERLLLKSKLRRALARDEFVIRYQPKVDLRSSEVVGAEALLRWRLPGHGDIAPAQFIPLAEETSLILDIGAWVLNQVCQDYAEWQKRVPDPGRVAINLSLKELRQASFLPRCRSVFERHGVSPGRVELEITETTLMMDAERTVALLDELRSMGVHLSIDDFGTGYSSLSALQQFPIGTLKIDQSFVRNAATDPDDATIVQTIIDMGRSLRLQVLAEGIETEEQRQFLLQSGCQFGQGRLFGEPMSAAEFLDLMLRQSTGGHPVLQRPA